MTATAPPDHTPIIVGSGQYTELLADGETPLLNPPMALAATASQTALDDAGIPADQLDTVAVIRLFSDSAPAWRCPFGGSDNPPASIAQRIGAQPAQRIYSNAGGTQPLQILAELFSAIARGDVGIALLAGAEAIASQRHAQRNELQPDWSEHFELPMDERKYVQRFAAPQELASGMCLPAHYYSLIENRQARELGHSPQAHQSYMGQMFAPFSQVAAANPLAFYRQAFDATDLAAAAGGNYPITQPYTKRLVAQDAVNQGAALALTSVGKARELGIPRDQWIFLQGYGEGSDHYLLLRENICRSAAMTQVLTESLSMAGTDSTALDLIDIYSCFPCAVQAAAEALSLPIDGSRPLTITGGLPFFGGPGNNYTTHALAEMARQLRGRESRGLVTANGGILSKHAAAVLSTSPGADCIDWRQGLPFEVDSEAIGTRETIDADTQGSVLSYTVIAMRDAADIAVIMGESAAGERFLAGNSDVSVTQELWRSSPIGRAISTSWDGERHHFSFAD